MRHQEHHMHLHVCIHRTSGVWVLVLVLVLLGMADSTRAQPVDIPATWGGDFWSRPRLTGSWGGLRDELGKKGVVLDVDLLQTLQGVAGGGRNDVATYWGTAEYTLNVDTQKLGLWPGGFLRVQGLSSFGQNINHASGALLSPNFASLLPEPGNSTTGLMNLTFMQ
jgi:porin